MGTNRLLALCLSVAILTVGFLTIPRVWAYTSAEYRTGTGAYRIVDAPGTGQAPFVYCTVSPATFSIKATNGTAGRQNVTLTCYNYFKHNISLSIACSVSPSFTPGNPYVAPTCTSPTTINSVVAGSSATSPNIQVRATTGTTTGSYRLNFTITTTGTGLPVDVSVPMSSSFQVTP